MSAQKTMNAVRHQRYGDASVLTLQSLAKPTISDSQVLIKVHASSASSGDVHMRQANPWAVRLFNGLFKPKRQILGCEFAGIVKTTGSDVTHFKIGDRVFGGTGMALGANAEYLALAEDAALALIPDNISFAEAAAIPFGAAASLHFLRDKIKLEQGQRILINGASGALGVYAVQLAKYYGAEVTAVCSAKNSERVLSLGASQHIDYQQQDLYKCTQQFDVIYDTIGNLNFNQYRHLLSDKGIFASAAAGLKEWAQMLCNPLRRGKKVIASVAVETQADIKYLQQLMTDKTLNAVIDSHHPLAELATAHRRVESGRKVGAVIISNTLA